MLFQAIGARYSLGGALRYLLGYGTRADHDQLTQLLELRYQGEVTLYRKGRAALAEAVRLATGGEGTVLVSGLTCYSVPQAVEATGAAVRYVDIAIESLQLSVDTLEAALKVTPHVKAVVVQNMLGIPADMAAIERLAATYKFHIIEDLAHSAGAHYADGREVGTVGDITMLSFGRDKAIDSVNGGALVVRRTDLKGKATQPSRLPRLRDRLRDRLYPLIAWKTRWLYAIGFGKYIMATAIRMKLVVRSADGPVLISERLPYWQARTALRQLERLDDTVRGRQEVTKWYRELLPIAFPEAATASGASLARIPVLLDNRDHVIYQLLKAGVHVQDIWYDVPVSPQRYFEKAHYPTRDNPVSVEVADRLINLPTHHKVTRRDVETIARVLEKEANA